MLIVALMEEITDSYHTRTSILECVKSLAEREGGNKNARRAIWSFANGGVRWCIPCCVRAYIWGAGRLLGFVDIGRAGSPLPADVLTVAHCDEQGISVLMMRLVFTQSDGGEDVCGNVFRYCFSR